MELSHKASLETFTATRKLLKNESIDCDIVICPSFPSLADLAKAVPKNQKFQIGAQNIHWEERGAWTGQVSVLQIRPFVTWCIVGHSEQRALTQETEEEVDLKVNLLLKHGIAPIVCVGETADERQAEQTTAKITAQVSTLLARLTRMDMAKVVVAYEPIWAIGSGITPDPAEAAGIMLLIRKLAAERFGSGTAERLRIVYGGSVNVDNVHEFSAEPGVDGVLVGGASVQPTQLARIIKIVQESGT